MYGLLVTLAFSRYAFLAIALRQDLAAVLDGLEAAWTFFGRVVRRLVADNLKPVVTRPDRYHPHVNRVFLEYAQHRGFIVDPALPDHATGKPEVERAVPYAREDYFRDEVVRDLVEMHTRGHVGAGHRGQPRARHHMPGSARRVRARGAVAAAAARAGAVQSSDLGPGHRPS